MNAENAAILAEEWLTEREFLWGDPEDYSFDGQRWRLTYDTPAGEEPTRAVIVDCRTGAVTPG